MSLEKTQTHLRCFICQLFPKELKCDRHVGNHVELATSADIVSSLGYLNLTTRNPNCHISYHAQVVAITPEQFNQPNNKFHNN